MAGTNCKGTTTLNTAEITQNTAGGDYLSIIGANNDPTTCTTAAAANKICGVFFTTTHDTIVHNTICTCATPFKVDVHFDPDEAVYVPLTPAKLNTNENQTPTLGAGFGLGGFWLAYWQVAC